MNANDKRRLKKYFANLDTVRGDDAAPSDASLYANLLAQTGLNVMQTVDQKKKADEARKKAEADKAAAVNPERDAAMADYKQKQKAAAMAAADAHAAQLKAATEPSTAPPGPLHVAATQAAAKAALYAADAQAAADKVAFYGGVLPSTALTTKEKGGFKMPSWVLPVGIGVGVLGMGLIAYKLLKRRK
jgi:hypothetical protein